MERKKTSGRGRLVGFTLIEMLVTVSIVGILAAIAYPSYVAQIQKVRRADAQTVLMQNAQILERIYTQTGCYNPGPDMDCQDADDNANFTQLHLKSPVDGDATYYTIGHFEASTADTYKLTADPVGSQAGTGFLTLDSVGRKTWDENGNNDDTDADEDDWDRG